MWKDSGRFLLLILLLFASLTVAAIDNDFSEFTGQITYVGDDHNVYNLRLADNTTYQLTTDASATRHYQWPTWSNDGRLAYFCCDLGVATSFDSQAYISQNARLPGDLVYEGEGNTVIYASWAPENCDDGFNCRDLALLINDVRSGGLSIEMVRNRADNTTSQQIGVGSPFYYHWNPDGTRLIFHRNNRRLDIYDMGLASISTEFEQRSSGAYQTPAWSPVDDRVLFGVNGENRGTTDLVIAENGEARTLLKGLNGFVSFLWSPNGRFIAYRLLSQEFLSPVFVIDSQSGELVSQGSVNGILAFFWSPDSRKIAYVTLSSQLESANVHNGQHANRTLVQDDGPPRFVWLVHDVEANTDLRYSSFLGTTEMVYLLNFFDQFAPSHRVWSPDSRHIVYSELLRVANNADLQPTVSVIDVNDPTVAPVNIADGVFAIWSFQ